MIWYPSYFAKYLCDSTFYFILFIYLFIFGVGPGTARTLGYIRKYVHVSICRTELRQYARIHRNARSLNGIKFSQPEDLEMQVVLPGTSRQLARHYAGDNDAFDLRQQLMPTFGLFPGLLVDYDLAKYRCYSIRNPRFILRKWMKSIQPNFLNFYFKSLDRIDKKIIGISFLC